MKKIAVIGAGPIGLYISSLLINSQTEIHLIEAGNSDVESNYLNYGSYNFKSKSKMPSGTHRLYGGANFWRSRIGEFLESDFVSFNSARKNSWPFSKSELNSGYEGVIQSLKVNCPSDAIAEEDFKKFASEMQLYPELRIRTHKFLSKNIWQEIYNNLLNQKNFHLYFNTYCDEIFPVNETGRISLSLVFDSKTRLEEYDYVVVAAGAFQSTALLMRSKKLDIQSEGILGHGLMEHLEGVVGRVRVFSRKNKQLFKKLMLDEKFRFHTKNYGGGVYLSDSKISYHLEIIPLTENFEHPKFKSRRVIFVKIYHKIQIVLEKLFFKANHYSLNLKSEEFMCSESILEFDETTKKLTYCHKVNEVTLSTIRSELLRIKEYFKVKKLGSILFDKNLYRDLKYLELNPNWHPMGTTRIGLDKNSSVVDLNLALHGHRQIFILSSSIFPTGSNSNPTFTTLALAFRLYNHLLKLELKG